MDNITLKQNTKMVAPQDAQRSRKYRRPCCPFCCEKLKDTLYRVAVISIRVLACLIPAGAAATGAYFAITAILTSTLPYIGVYFLALITFVAAGVIAIIGFHFMAALLADCGCMS